VAVQIWLPQALAHSISSLTAAIQKPISGTSNCTIEEK
jgi:hypothetical protein